MVSIVVYDLIYLSFFKISFRPLSMHSRSYIFVSEITVILMPFFAFDNIESFSFPMKNYESESDEAFRRSFPIVFSPRHYATLAARTSLSMSCVLTFTIKLQVRRSPHRRIYYLGYPLGSLADKTPTISIGEFLCLIGLVRSLLRARVDALLDFVEVIFFRID
jgi:hypothetical protein